MEKVDEDFSTGGLAPGGSGRFPWTLMYHSVARDEDDPYLITVSPRRFRQQIRWLAARGLRGVGVGALMRAHALGRARGLVGLSFDDGYRDFAEQAVPVLEEYGFTATVYVVAGKLSGHNDWDREGPRKALMSPRQVREVAAAGLEIGSHGLTHRRLAGLGRRELVAQVADSRAALQDVTGEEVAGFCYPYGSYDRAAAEAVGEAGYGYACATGRGGDDRLALPRCYVGQRDGAVRLAVKRGLHRWRS
ncbi:polysaccharide deacetylase family protein [Kitasatospora sp. NRRL B-11411]|uniref:polysaccharide deacetylase family protein n=1 Tax=Kitasatospora sp. NRRL B-11411 TaxID=1463822 RepID=UPI000692017A|nr:polysaccharide deacetylase family protein [Kitasatospora sp. NRRL B-11411]